MTAAQDKQTGPLLELISQTRALPESHPSKDGVRTVPLSLLDNTVIRFAMTNAAWYYDKPKEHPEALSPDALTRSLRKTLDIYPQWAGQLQWLPDDRSDEQPERQNRACLTFGFLEDPGIDLIVARSPATLASLVPDTETRVGGGVWCADQFPSNELLYPTYVALCNPSDYIGRPCICIQITTFSCGAVGIALRMAHTLADATTLMQFVRNWSAIHRATLGEQAPALLPTLFDPSFVDKAASGDAKVAEPDPELIRISRSLPVLKHDWSSLAPRSTLTKSGAAYDVDPPVTHYMVYITPAELQGIWEDATASAPAGARISRHDALLAFIWRLITRARSPEPDSLSDTAPVHMIVTVGIRARVDPPLPEGFLGSPIVLARVSLPARDVAASTSPGAVAIRSAVAAFTPETIGALLYDIGHKPDMQRHWQAFLRRGNAPYTCWRSLDVYALDYGTGARPPYIESVMPSMDGTRHSVVTSWQDLDVYGIDFGAGVSARYVDGFIPNMDGCIHITEAGPLAGERKRGRWYDNTVCLSMHLATEVMHNVLRDPELRKYSTQQS
ncbi:transferase family-domain-containing protein [Trametes polyzona]|nr:transferase family-domain-containing protein [Trametes polyzona]